MTLLTGSGNPEQVKNIAEDSDGVGFRDMATPEMKVCRRGFV